MGNEIQMRALIIESIFQSSLLITMSGLTMKFKNKLLTKTKEVMSIKNKIVSCLILSLFLFIGCKNDDYVEETSEGSQIFQKAGGSSITICGKTILKFNTLDQIQNAHKELYYDYYASGEDEDVLIAFEMSKGLYSLRKKEQDMDDGVIPDEPDFDAYDYTSDDVFEAILNQDGMVIIGEYLYLWSDGCVAYRIKPATCKNYKALLDLMELGKNGTVNDRDLAYYINDVGVEIIDICGDPRYDFESISEIGVHIDNDADYGDDDRGLECGFQPVLSYDILEHDGDSKTIKIKFEAYSVAPIGSTPNYLTYIDNADSFTSITFTEENSLSLPETDWTSEYAYVGKWFVVEIDYTDSDAAPIMNTRLFGSVYTFSPNSCSGEDTLDLNLECPVGISAIPVDADSGLWSFTVEGLEDIVEPYSIEWTFAGGYTEIIDNANGNSFIFPVPCTIQNFGVSAYVISPGICKSQLSTSIESGNLCHRRRVNKKYKVKFDGKNVRMKMKVRKRLDIFGGTTVFKNKMKYRKNGRKSFNTSGQVLLLTGVSCSAVDMAALLPPDMQTEDTKKKFKQKLSDGNIYLVDLNIPYEVTFAHTNGFSHTLTFSQPCSE